jgi:S-adenosylmethionine decarboxylase
MAKPFPQITVITEAEADHARADVRPVPAPRPSNADQPEALAQVDLFGHTEEAKPKDYFVEKDGLRYAGSHLILDMWGATNLDDEDLVRQAFADAVEAAGATLLHIHTHQFSENGGVSGVAVLAESHISVHTWPERDYAAFDIFMCGDAVPAKAIPALRAAFKPAHVSIVEQKRGVF